MTVTATAPPVADWVTIPELYRDPFPIFERLRAESPVAWVPAVNRYLVTTYAGVHATELDQGTFSANEEGSLMIRAMGHSMLRKDDPEHLVERRAWQPTLKQGSVKKQWAPVYRANAEKYFQHFVEMGPGSDLIAHFAAPYVAENLREMIGFNNATWQDMLRWSQDMIDGTGNYADDPAVWARSQKAYDEVDEALDEMLQWHAKNPNPSLLSTLLGLPEERMPLESIRANVKMTIGGGVNEPRDVIGTATWALLERPEQRKLVEADPHLWSTVFEEAIRWVAPIGMYSRQTTREVELEGVTLPAGARLGVCILSANRDETVWNNAGEFDITRENKPHLAFGKGPHVCLGTWAARSEVGDIALPMLFDRLRGLRLDPEHPARVGGWVFRGMLELPVLWDEITP